MATKPKYIPIDPYGMPGVTVIGRPMSRPTKQWVDYSTYIGQGASVVEKAGESDVDLILPPLSPKEQLKLDELLGQPRGTNAKFPLGPNINIFGSNLFKVPGLPSILQAAQKQIDKIIRERKVPPPIVVQRRKPVQVAPPVVIPRPQVSTSPASILSSQGWPNQPNEGAKIMGLDLGSLLQTGIEQYGAYKTAKFTPAAFNPGALNPFSDVPLANLFDDGAQNVVIPKGYTVNADGHLCKKRRRRRKRLATSSDIKDLAALSSVTTPAEKKTWIATHPS